MIKVIISSALLFLLGVTSAAQGSPGGLVGIVGPALVEFRGGTVVTLVPSFGGQDLTVSPDSHAYGTTRVISQGPGQDRIFVEEYRGGLRSTLATFLGPTGGARIDVDQDGDYLVASANFLRINRSGVSTVSATGPYNFCDDVARGGWYTTAFFGTNLNHIARNGTFTTVAGLGVITWTGLWNDPLTGDVYITTIGGATVLRFDPVTRAVTSLSPQPLPFNGSFDPRDGSVVFTSTTAGIFRATRNFTNITTIARGPSAVNTEFAKRRNVGGLTPAVEGQPYQINVSFPNFAGFNYAVAASFGFRQGIRIRGTRIPLDPDALFNASLRLPAIFRRFTGQLSASGQAFAEIRIPRGGLRGLRFFVAATALDGQGRPVATSRPLGVTIG